MYFARGLKAILVVTGSIAIVGMLPDLAAAQTTPFQQVKNLNCTASQCSLTFLVPVGERREVTSVSCSAEVSPNTMPLRTAQLLAFNQSGALIGGQILVPTKIGENSSFSHIRMNHQVFIFATSGGKFQAVFGTQNATEVDVACTISGHRIKP
jgi:hypothetical protein